MILIVAGGIRFGFVIWNAYNSFQAELSMEEIGSQHYRNSFTANPSHTFLKIPNMTIALELPAPSSIEILFTCIAGIVSDPNELGGLYFYFSVDNIRITDNWIYLASYYKGAPIYYYSVSFQHTTSVISSGTHYVSVVVYSTLDTNYIRSSSLRIKRSVI